MPDRKNRKVRTWVEPGKVPNKETVEALRQSRDGVDLEEYASFEEFKAAFEQGESD